MIRVQEDDFDVGAEIARLTDGRTDIGGVCAFVGLVRDMANVGGANVGGANVGGATVGGAGDVPVKAMTLEHYPGMTEKELARIEAKACERWPLEATLIVHRFGRHEPGDRIVLVVTASAHRQAAFDACHFLIDWLKTQAPFWKREDGPGGGGWVEARGDDDDAAARWAAKD